MEKHRQTRAASADDLITEEIIVAAVEAYDGAKRFPLTAALRAVAPLIAARAADMEDGWVERLRELQGHWMNKLNGAVAAEREACAKIAEARSQVVTMEGDPSDVGARAEAEFIAAAIRARGERQQAWTYISTDGSVTDGKP